MKNDIKIPWLTIWVIVFGVIAGWAIFLSNTEHIRSTWSVSILIAIVLAVGLEQLSRLLSDRRSVLPILDDLGRIYLDAWRQLWRRKWILVPFLVVALVNALGIAVQGIIIARFIPNKESLHWMRSVPASPLAIGWGQWLHQRISRGLESSIYTILHSFKPRSGAANVVEVYAIHAVLFLVAVIWINRRLKSLAGDSEYAPHVAFARTVLVPVAIASVGAAYVLMRSALDAAAVFASGAQWRPGVMSYLAGYVETLYFAVLAGFLIAGLAGSLKRTASGGAVSLDSYIKDAVRYFKPVLAAYLVVYAIESLLTLQQMILWAPGEVAGGWLLGLTISIVAAQLIAPFLMLLPYAAVVHDVGGWEGIKRGFRDWFANTWEVVSFIALGFTFLAVVYIVDNTLSEYLRWLPRPLNTVWASLRILVISALIPPTIAVAIWSFYQRISGTRVAEKASAGE